MTTFVLDGSITIAWCQRDNPDHYADDVLNSLSDATAVAPAIWPLEVVNVLLAAERRQRVTRFQSRQFLNTLQMLPIQVEDHGDASPMESLLDVASRHGLTAYDAAYLDVALRRGIPLATLDAALRKACATAGIALFQC